MPRILLDSCVWGGALQELRELAHDVTWSGSWAADPGDAAILAAAHRIAPESREAPIHNRAERTEGEA